MRKKVVIIIVAIIIILTIAIIINFISNNSLRKNGLVGIGKTLTINITKKPVINHASLKNVIAIDLWDRSERNKLEKYMKNNNLQIKTGTYQINQGTTFEKSLEIFIFEKNTNH
ncbi:hypothetical protein PV797_08795 [Clostridiaceae bacterium M8S5]|nr:hypothetical protein PV797_08795 [Clostridiaceae bacterium M8S5]